jgi:hypothetical protein
MMKSIVVGAIVLGASLSACMPSRPPVAPAVYVTTEANSSATLNATEASGSCSEPAPATPVTGISARSVVVLVDKRVDRPTEVVGVLDFHSNANGMDKGFDELRARAAALGADAVLGAEFEHGDDGGPSHLSGMAVRFLDH